MKKITICIFSIFLIFMMNSNCFSDPLGGIDELILETMRNNRYADSMNDKTKKDQTRKENTGDNTRKKEDTRRDSKDYNTRKNEKNRRDRNDNIRAVQSPGVKILQLGNYFVKINLPNGWHVQKQNQTNRNSSIFVVHNSGRAAVFLGVEETFGRNAQQICHSGMRQRGVERPVVNVSIPQTYCEFEADLVRGNSRERFVTEVMVDGRYYTMNMRLGDKSLGKDISNNIERFYK